MPQIEICRYVTKCIVKNLTIKLLYLKPKFTSNEILSVMKKCHKKHVKNLYMSV